MIKTQKSSRMLPAIIVDGTVFAQIERKDEKARVDLSVGTASVPMVRSDVNPLTAFSINTDMPFDMNVAVEQTTVSGPKDAHAGYVDVSVNGLTDWALAGSQTLQVKIQTYDQPLRVAFGAPIEIEQATPKMTFQTLVAQHRIHGNLLVTFTDRATGAVSDHTVPLSPAAGGGISPETYQNVQMPLPDGFENGTVQLALEYLHYVPDDQPVEPFFFMADTRVTSPKAASRRLTTPRIIAAPTNTGGRVWMKAPLPAPMLGGDEMVLTVGSARTSLLTLEQPRLTLKDDYGHTLVLESDTALDLVLFVDGAPVEKLNFGTSHNVLRLPVKFLTGATRHLSLRDASGTFTYWQTQMLTPSIITPADVMLRETPAPYSSTLFAQTPRRFAGLRSIMEHADETVDLAQVAYAMSVVEGGYDNVKLKPLKFNRPDTPDVSIIIPAHNKVEVTYLALCSLLATYNKATFEVIVVDDASTDETATLETIVSGITVLHNEVAQRFIRACNRGGEAAKGEYIVLLNNDVEVTNLWLDELIAAFDRFDNVGLAGSKLLYPNGTLQDAGGIIWGTGNPWNYGNGQNPEDPRYSYARQADYLSGAAMMVPTKLWRALGGLSSYLEPMYFEDTDFAFKVRDAGYTTWFVPASVVYHYEGMTSGTDVTTGYKKYQEVNRPKFKRKWARAFPAFGKEGHRPDLEKDRGIVGRVLFIDYSTPREDQDAGSYAAMQEIKLVQSLGYKVSFLPNNLAHLGSYTETLQKMGVEVIYAPFYLSQAEYLSQHAADFDAFYITRYYVANDVLTQLRAAAPNAKILFNNADLHFLREIRAARAEGDAKMLEKARATRSEEMAIINSVDVVLSYNDVEHSVIQAYSDGAATVVKCPWVVDIPKQAPKLAGRKGMSFLGSFRHHPNTEGVTWFVRDVLPVLAGRAKTPPHLTIYGSGMTPEIKALASDLVDPVGFVQDIADAYDSHRVFVAPLRSGAGIKGKVLSALAHGIPCVLTPTAAEGIGLRHGHDCFIAETPTQWAEAISRLMAEDDLWKTMSAHAQGYMREAFSFERGREHMREAFEAATLFQSLD